MGRDDAGAVQRPGPAGIDLDVVNDAVVGYLRLGGRHPGHPVAARRLASDGDLRIAAHANPQHVQAV